MISPLIPVCQTTNELFQRFLQVRQEMPIFTAILPNVIHRSHLHHAIEKNAKCRQTSPLQLEKGTLKCCDAEEHLSMRSFGVSSAPLR
jgi:hypothetical protein